MARRNPGIPGFGDIPGGGGNQDDIYSGGDLDLSADGGRTMPAGAGVPGFNSTTGSKVQLTKDEAVVAALAGLRGDVSVLADMKRQFDTLIGITAQNADHLGALRRESAQQAQDMISAINRIGEGISRQNATGGYQGLAGQPFRSGGGRATAGYTTADDLYAATGRGTIFGGPAFGVGSASIRLNNSPSSAYPYVVSSAGTVTGGNSPGSGLIPRQRGPVLFPPGAGGVGVPGGGGGGGGGGGLAPYNAGSGPGPGPHPNYGASIRNIGTSLLRGGGLNYASGALAAGRLVYSGILDQRAENERFQQIEGGSNFAGFGERIHQTGFRLGHLGLSAADDNAIFQGITGFGIRGGERNRLADQVYRAKTNQGIGVNESLSALTAGASSASSALESVISGLRSVTTVANQFGLNAVRVRQLFTQNLQNITSNTSISGTAATSLAQSLTTSSAALGRTGLNISAAGFVSGGNETALTIVAANAGISTKQADTLARNSPATYQAVAGASITQVLSRILGPSIVSFINNALRNSGGAPNFVDIGQQVLDQWGADSFTLYNTIIAQLPGVTGLTRNNVGEWVVQQFSQSGVNGTLTRAAQAATTRVTADGRVIDTATGKAVSGAGTKHTLGSTIATGIQTTDSANQVGISSRHTTVSGTKVKVTAAGVTDTVVGNVESGKSAFGGVKDKAYQTSLQHSKGQIPQLELLGRRYGASGLKRIRVQLNTADGLTDLSLEDAIEAFPAIVASGTPKIIAGAGSDNGKTLADIFGGNVANSAQDRKDAATQAHSKAAAKTVEDLGSLNHSAVLDKNLKGKKSNFKKFDLADYWNAQKQNGQANGTVTVTLSDNAQQLLKLIGPGSNSAATTGTPNSVSLDGSRGGPSDPSN